MEREEVEVGAVIGERYVITRELGRGAGGVVFEALHRITGRATAIKLLGPDIPPSLVGPMCERLLREARALSAVRHPGIVEVLDAGYLPDSTPFVVLEKLEGRSLEGLLAIRGKLSKDAALAIGLQLCDALDALHRAGIVHRDLKPANIFIVRDRDGLERLKLLDFGIAQVPEPNQEKLTHMGAIVGTPAYMPPEQLLAAEVDHRADVYALGATLFECLTGRLPYEGNYQTILMKACSYAEPLPRVSDHVTDLEHDIAEVIARAMARRADERIASALDFGRFLFSTVPGLRSQTFFLGPPPIPKFGPPSTKATGAQRRRAPRAVYATPVQIELEGGMVLAARSEDISDGGLLVICRHDAPVGHVATLRFASPIEGHIAVCRAHVRWSRASRPDVTDSPRALGLEFIDLSPSVRAAIARYVQLSGD